MASATRSTPDWSSRSFHLLGIGGAGMSGLALVASSLGARVSGSDQAESAVTERLRAAGVDVFIGHAVANVPEGAEVVVSSAIADDNPELVAARGRQQAVLHRVDLLAQLARLGRAIVISGTHGKTTTTSMVAHIFDQLDMAPGYLIGGDLRSTGTNAAWGGGEWVMLEGDESDGSFLALDPEIAVVTNVELDHHSRWRTLDELRAAFVQFAGSARVLVAPDDLVEDLPALHANETVTYGIGAGALRADAMVADGLATSFSVDGVAVRLELPGRHNVLNALAALGACGAAGVDLTDAAAALASFTGAGRRFEERGRTAVGAHVFDDYAHHPTEVRATLEAARALDAGRVVACFQPHLYSRTRHLAREFGAALALADVVCVLDVYRAREDPVDFPGVSGWLVAASASDAARGRPVYWAPSIDDAARLMEPLIEEDDVVLTMGAGDVNRLADRLVSDGAG